MVNPRSAQIRAIWATLRSKPGMVKKLGLRNVVTKLKAVGYKPGAANIKGIQHIPGSSKKLLTFNDHHFDSTSMIPITKKLTRKVVLKELTRMRQTHKTYKKG